MYLFESSTGKLFGTDGSLIETGYAGGDKGLHKEGINNPNMQDVPDIGPLPEGIYTMGTPVEGTHLGLLAIPLTPENTNTMFGRSGFYIHGDVIGAPGTASDGCIVMSHATRVTLSKCPFQQIQVVAYR